MRHDPRRTRLMLLAAAGSAGLLAAAFAFQYIGGYAPCTMCLWQRWPHAAAMIVGVLALVAPARVWPLVGALAATIAAALALYHTGVERAWWEGPSTCTSGSIAGVAPADLLSQILAAPVVRCDEVAWQMLGLSMASWNGLASVFLAGLWLMAATARQRGT